MSRLHQSAEIYEPRLVLSAVTLSNGVLSITLDDTEQNIAVYSSETADQIIVEVDGGVVAIQSSATVDSIAIAANDWANIVDVSGLALGAVEATSIDLGAGNDTMIGSMAIDSINGGDGDDIIIAGGSSDVAGGGDGNDILIGNSGSDVLDGGADSDQLFGQRGTDTIDGGTGQDSLTGGDGQDDLQSEEDDVVTDISIIALSQPAFESDGTLEVRLILSDFTTQFVSVDYVLSDLTAISGQDYLMPGAPSTVVLAPGVVETSVAIPLIDDAQLEPEEQFEIEFVRATNASMATDSVILNIQDDDDGVGVTASSLTVDEDAGSALVPFQLTTPSSQSVSVTVDIVDGSASNPFDYLAAATTVTFLPGQVAQTLAVPIVDDADYEFDESFFVRLVDAVGAAPLVPEVAVVIKDNEPDPPGDLRIQAKNEKGRTYELNDPQELSPGAVIALNPVAGKRKLAHDLIEVKVLGPANTQYTLEFTPAKITLWEEKEVQNAIVSGDEITAGDSFFVDGTQLSTKIADERVKLNLNGNLVDEIAFTVINADLDAATISAYGATKEESSDNAPNGVLADNIEATEGAFVPVNNDDDDYDQKPDLQKSPKGQYENDLLPITVESSLISANAEFKLRTNNTIKIGADATGQNPIGSKKQKLSPNPKKTLFVEGRQQGAANVKLDFTLGTNWLFETDILLVNVFEWTGRLNVPGYTSYSYVAQGGKPGNNSGWIDPISGTLNGTVAGSDANGQRDVGTILWSNRAEIGVAVYQASASYQWGLDVNIVSITLANTEFKVSGKTVHQDKLCGNDGFVISAKGAATNPAVYAMESSVDVVLSGPIVEGKQRGIEFIDLGFIQHVRDRTYNIELSGPMNAKRTVHHQAEGNDRVLDQVTRSCTKDLPHPVPWYNGATKTNGLQDGYFLGKDEFQDDSIQDPVDRRLWIADVPATPLMTSVTDPLTTAIFDPTKLNLIWNFDLYLATTTQDSGVLDGTGLAQNVLANSGSLNDAKYTQRAKAAWTFNGTGKLQGASTTAYPTWTADGAEVTSPNKNGLSLVESGALVPDVRRENYGSPTVYNVELIAWQDKKGNPVKAEHTVQ